MRQEIFRLPARVFTSKKKDLRKYRINTVTFLRRRPLTSFFATLLILLLLIFAGNIIAKPAAEVTVSQAEKKVDVYTIGAIPKINVQAQVLKDGVVTIMAQSPGIVQKVSVNAGDSVRKGAGLVSLSTNYQGGSAASLSRQIAEVQLANVNDTFDRQKDVIAKQKDLATKSAENTDQLRQISQKSLDDTNSLINLNQDIVNTLNSNLQTLVNTNVGGTNDALILATKQQISSFQSAVNQLNTSSRNLSFSTNVDNQPTKMANLSRDIAIGQLEVQEKALDLSKKVARIQLNLAQVNEALMFPAAPVSGVVQKIYVHTGQSVTPGTQLVTIYNAGGNVSAIARVPQRVAASVSRIEESQLHIGDRTFGELPDFVSTQATDAQQYSIIFTIPEEFRDLTSNMGFITVEIPIGHTDSNSVIPFIPLEAVFQTRDSAFVYVIDGQKALSRKVTLGEVFGQDVAVVSGLSDGDQIILSRNIMSGDLVSKNQ